MTELRTDVSVLYVDPRGPYPKLVADWWDEKRDARNYAGPNPVVAHPPCGPYGRLKHLYQGSEHDCALRAIDQVRRLGGVLEHPRKSDLWKVPHRTDGFTVFLPLPGDAFTDPWGGYTVEVDQVEWGHVARKTTWLYCVKVPRDSITTPPFPGRAPTHWVSGFRTSDKRRAYPQHYKKSGCAVPEGIKVCSAQQRRRTPPAFAEWLISLAAQAGPFYLPKNTAHPSFAVPHRGEKAGLADE